MLTKTQDKIIEILRAEGREMYGLEIVKASGGVVKRGVVYVDLQRLEDAGWVLSREEPEEDVPDGIPRRLYKLRPGGRCVPENEEVPLFDLGTLQPA